MTQYSVDVDQSQIQSAVSLFEFCGGNSDRAMQVAINRSLKKMATGTKVRSISKRIREQVNLPAAYVNGGKFNTKRIALDKASRKKLQGAIKALYRGVLLSRYSTNPAVRTDGQKKSTLQVPKAPARGIRVKVKPGAGTETLSSDHFYMRLKNSGVIGIATRTGSGPKRGYDVKYGPSIGQVMRGKGRDGVRDQAIPESSDVLEFELLDAMRFLLAKSFPKE